MYIVAIDGASRNNGRLSCVATGGVYIAKRLMSTNLDVEVLEPVTSLAKVEIGSTNQRGEMIALLIALEYLEKFDESEDAIIVTDSEYLFNTITKRWFVSWESGGWIKADGDIVKNADLWKLIAASIRRLKMEFQMIHVKGHTLSIGAVTQEKILREDTTMDALYQAFLAKAANKEYKVALSKIDEVSKKNNGYALPMQVLDCLLAMNCVADSIATSYMDYVTGKTCRDNTDAYQIYLDTNDCSDLLRVANWADTL